MMEKKHYLNRICVLLFLSLCANYCSSQICDPLTRDSITDPGIYHVASLTEADGIRNGPDYAGATIYYPTNAAPPFTSIVIVPGYVSPQSSIQSWGPFLASHGIVTMTIGTNSIFEQPLSRKEALQDAIVSLLGENTRTSSPLIGNLATDHIAVGGWSMGGGGAQLAAVEDTSIKAVMALCPWLDNAVITAADLNHPVPVLIFSAELDAIAPPASHADIHYGFTPQTTKKLIYEINNAGHTVANSPSGGQGFIGKIALSWLKQFLVGDTCYCPLLLGSPSTASKYMTNVDCQTIATSVNDINLESDFLFRLYPNPGRGRLKLEVQNVDHQTQCEIVSMTGAWVSSGAIVDRITTIDIQDLPSGMYIMNVKTSLLSERIKFIVR